MRVFESDNVFLSRISGGVTEWSNVPVLKTGVPKGTGGSNPSASAKQKPISETVGFCF